MLAGPELQVFSSRQPTEPLGTIGIPVRDHVNAATVMSLVTSALGSGWLPMASSVDVLVCQGNVLTMQRNSLVKRMRGDWLLFVDDDMAFQPDQIGRIIETRREHDLDVVGGLCFRRSPPHQPTMFMRERPDGGAFNYLEDWDDGGLVEVDATGMAFTLIHRRVFERISGCEMPSYEERMALGEPGFFRWSGGYGEDLQFCIDARAAGSRIWVDTSIEIGHMAELEVRRKHFLLEVAMRDEETEEERRRVNGAMGLPTLSSGEARRRLGL